MIFLLEILVYLVGVLYLRRHPEAFDHLRPFLGWMKETPRKPSSLGPLDSSQIKAWLYHR